MTTVSREAWEDLGWWTQALKTDVCAQARERDAATLSINWEDGSGTGTGGTNQWIDAKGPVAQLDMWMGVWTDQVHHFDRSSNWKELRTIFLDLERHASSNVLQSGDIVTQLRASTLSLACKNDLSSAFSVQGSADILCFA